MVSEQILQDKNALSELIYTYAMCMDELDFATMRNCFADTISLEFTDHHKALFHETDYLPNDIPDTITDPDFWLELLRSFKPGFDNTMHAVVSPIHQVNGDTAKSKCYVINENFLTEDGVDREFSGAGSYTFDSVRTMEGWKITNFVFQVLYTRGDPKIHHTAAERVRAKRGASR